jgi:hypothetical protein
MRSRADRAGAEFTRRRQLALGVAGHAVKQDDLLLAGGDLGDERLHQQVAAADIRRDGGQHLRECVALRQLHAAAAGA